MAFLGFIGGAILGVGAGTTAAMIVGGMVVGAVVGGLYSALTGGNILKGVLFGAIGGAVVGYGGAVLGFAGGAGGGAGAGAGVAAPTAVESSLGVTQVATPGLMQGGTAGGMTAGGAGLFTAEGLTAVAAVGSMGSAFLAGGAQPTVDDLARESQLDRESREKIAATSARSAVEAAHVRARTAKQEIEESARQFDKSYAYNEYTYGEDYRRTRKEKAEHNEGIRGLSESMESEDRPTVSLVEVQSQRKRLPAPVWDRGPTTTREVSA